MGRLKMGKKITSKHLKKFTKPLILAFETNDVASSYIEPFFVVGGGGLVAHCPHEVVVCKANS